jgi:flagellar biosynthesis protein FlhF
MNIKTLTAPSIQEALAAARQTLGDDVVLLESVAAQDGQLARITVMVDEPLPTPARRPQPQPEPVPAYAGAEARSGYGYAAAPRPGRTAAPEGSTYTRGAQFSAPAPAPRRRLFPETPPAPAPQQPAFDAARFEQMIGRILDERMQPLLQRLDGIERAGGTMLDAVQRWAAHPLFAELLGQGFRAETVGALFQRAADDGYHPGGEREQELRWAVARALRNRLDHTIPTRNATGSLVVLGPSGAGKTSLLLKLATHPSFYGRQQTAVLVLAPEDTEGMPYHDPTDLYRRFGLPVQTARTPQEVTQALERTAQFDRLLIDTPPMPVRPREAQRFVARIQQLLHALVPLDVHLVLDATRALDGFDASYLQRLPLRPTSASLTRLDEAFGWGRVAEWLLALDLPIRFASTGPHVPNGLQQFAPGWFVEQLVQRVGETGEHLNPTWT